MITPSATKAEIHDLPPLNVKKRPAESPTFSRKRRRHSYSSSQILGRSQLVHRKRLPSLTKISRKMINDTIQYLQMLSDHILIQNWDPLYARFVPHALR
jgi:hypothetical protein